ncbi:hypothetical protein NFI96_017579 [Prochilodus magdalenae]|nr:hypothetical protein NFI96_017579 [Prochilodus magdalenae]
MQTLLPVLFTLGLVAAFQSAQGEAEQVGRCSYAGVVHLEGSGRYSLTFQQAMQLCQSLGHSLATEEQLNQAYNKGLKTCRFGWIDNQKVSLLPHDADPTCTFSEIISHAEKEDKLYDVYCFTQTDSLEAHCENAHTSTPTSANTQPTTSNLNTTMAKPDLEEDVLGEAVADGFIVDAKATSSARSKTSTDHSKATTTPNSLTSKGKTFHSYQEDSVATESVAKTPEVTTADNEVSTSSTEEAPRNEYAETSAAINLAKDTTTLPTKQKSEGTTTQNTTPELKATEVKHTTEETINMNIEGSGMYLEPVQHENPLPTTNVSGPVGVIHSKTRLFQPAEVEEGSGMEPSVASERPVSTPQMTSVTEEKVNSELIEASMNAPVHHKQNNRIGLPAEPHPTTSARAEEGTPGWLIIFAFCMTLGAILCVLAGIATKDMWYGPSRRRLNITPQESNKEYGNSATLPLSEKEQELVILMNTENEQKNDKDFTAISLEAPEKEYLM